MGQGSPRPILHQQMPTNQVWHTRAMLAARHKAVWCKFGSSEEIADLLKPGRAVLKAKVIRRATTSFGFGRVDVALLEKADLSTFLHAAGHLYFKG